MIVGDGSFIGCLVSLLPALKWMVACNDGDKPCIDSRRIRAADPIAKAMMPHIAMAINRKEYVIFTCSCVGVTLAKLMEFGT